MRKLSISLIAFTFLFAPMAWSQIFPYLETFDTFPVNQPLDGHGGIAATSHVYVTPYGIVGNCAEFQMTDTAIVNTDTITSPVIGPLTVNTVTSFYFRAVTINNGVPVLYNMQYDDEAIILVGGAGGTGTLYIPQYTIDSTDQNTSTAYVKVVVGAPAWVSGLTGRFKIITYNPSGNNWKLEFDSLVVRDTVTIVIHPTVSSTVTNVKCRGTSTGEIKITASGASPPYTYLWSPGGQTADSIIDQPAGTYTVTVTDSLGATASLSVTIDQPAFALQLDSLSKTEVTCYGSNTGTATIYATGGTTPYQYEWSNSPPSHADSAVNLPAGNYSVTVTDALGCELTATTRITQPSVPLTTTTTSTQSSTGSNGTATVIPNGGTSPFTYLWSTSPPQTGPIATGLAPGLYYVTVTDGNNCQLIDTIFVAFPNGINTLENSNLSIYPNPASDQLYIKMTGGNNSYASATICDMTGRIVMEQEALTGTINISSLAEGIYIIRIITEKGIYQNRLTIQR